MKRLILSLIAPFALAAAATAAEVVPSDALLCTRDYNPWGQASQCACPDPTAYDSRIGYCLQGDPFTLSTAGEISTESVAIGGETTGFVLQTADEQQVELVLPIRLQEELKELQGEGILYAVQGDLVSFPGVERPDRPVLIVTEIQEYE